VKNVFGILVYSNEYAFPVLSLQMHVSRMMGTHLTLRKTEEIRAEAIYSRQEFTPFNIDLNSMCMNSEVT
jgi:hypothetical protein